MAADKVTAIVIRLHKKIHPVTADSNYGAWYKPRWNRQSQVAGLWWMDKKVQAKTKLITREGYNQLKAEHDELWFKKRPEVTKIVSWAASLGDRSENADWQKEPPKMYYLYVDYA